MIENAVHLPMIDQLQYRTVKSSYDDGSDIYEGAEVCIISFMEFYLASNTQLAQLPFE